MAIPGFEIRPDRAGTFRDRETLSAMPGNYRHRGPHPADEALFAPDQWADLRFAVADLSWLFSHGYAERSALKLVGDRYQLTTRQRVAVRRCACSDEALAKRGRHEVPASGLRGQALWLDGFNVLTTVEAAEAGGVLLRGRDGSLRDMASMHGTYRKVQETVPALDRIDRTLEELGVRAAIWFLDRPVSNSGRLKSLIEHLATERQRPWEVRLVPDPDRDLVGTDRIVATADSVILDQCERWCALARLVVARACPRARVVDLGDPDTSPRGGSGGTDEQEPCPP